MTVDRSFELVGEGEQSGFNGFEYRLYLGDRRPAAGEIQPPNDEYVRERLSAELRTGWKLIVAWDGPTSDRERECLITAETPSAGTDLPPELPRADRDDVTSGARFLLRVGASCSTPQHHFDGSP